MDSLSTQKAKPRKMKAFVKKSRVQILFDLFCRAIEITVVMVTVAKLCYQIVITFESSGLASFLINRHLAFVFGNAIVIALVAKCGFFVNQEPDARRNTNDFYDEFVRESSRGDRICREKQSEVKQITEENRAKQSSEDKNRAKQSTEDKRQSRAKQSTEDKNIAKQSTEDKSRESEKSTKQKSSEEIERKDIFVKKQRQNIGEDEESPRQSYQRSRSENLEGSKKNSCGKLKRSETERSVEGFESDDELRYKIESFIARQRRNQKDEEYTII